MLEAQTSAIDAGEQARCKQVYNRLTTRQRDVLWAFVHEMNPQDVAEHLAITLATVNSHTLVCDTVPSLNVTCKVLVPGASSVGD